LAYSYSGMQRHLILRVAGYILAAVVIVVGTISLIAYGNGYSYNITTGQLEHRGLLILQSTPSGAQIMVGKKHLSQQTPYHPTLLPGTYNFTLTKAGYRTWSEALWVVASQVDLAQYVILLPQHLAVSEVTTFPAVSQAVATRDHDKVAYLVPSGDDAGIWSIDTTSHQRTKLYTPAVATATTPAETVQILGWSDDDSRLLIQSQQGSTPTVLDLASNGTDQPINLSTTFNQTISSATFYPGDSHTLYWQSPDGLRRLDLDNQSVSNVLATHVAGFTFAGSKVLYVTTATSQPSLWSLDSSGNKTELVKKLPPSAHYELAFATYIGTPEAVVVAQDSHTAILYTSIYDDPVATPLAASATHASFNGDGRFAVLYDDTHVATYDVQRSTMYQMDAVNSSVTGLSWFDNYHLLFNRNGEIVLSEFNGNYAIAITRADSLPPTGSSDTKSVVASSPTSTGTTLIKAVTIRQ
jgi:hypothetical protein